MAQEAGIRGAAVAGATRAVVAGATRVEAGATNRATGPSPTTTRAPGVSKVPGAVRYVKTNFVPWLAT